MNQTPDSPSEIGSNMRRSRLRLIEQIFHSALDREPAQIRPFLDTACEGDQLLRLEVETLLALKKQAGGFLKPPAVILGASLLERVQPDLLAGQRIGHYEL